MKKEYELKRDINTEGKVFIGIPRERLYIPFFVDNRDQIMITLQKAGRGAGLYQHSSHRVDRNRDNIVEAFLNDPKKPEWLQFLDSDMDHPNNISIRLSKWGKPIIGGLYFHRKQTHDPFVFKDAPPLKDKYGRTTKSWRPMRDEVYQFFEENNIPMMDGAMTIDQTKNSPLVECDAVATGAMLIHRSVLEHMEKPLFEYRQYGNSEDLVFCHEAKHDYGIPIFCDLSTVSGHYIFSPQGQAQFRQKYQGRGLVFSGFTLPPAVDWLSGFLGISKEAAEEKLRSGNAHMAGDYWIGKFGDKEPTSKEVDEFYKDSYVGKLYLIELLHWNMSRTFHDIKSMFIGLRDMSVLEIGSGIGSLAIQLSVQKCKVTASEINDTLRNFAQYRTGQLRKEIGSELGAISYISEQWSKEPENTYDAVVSVDTFEHLTAEQAQKMLKDIARVIKPGGNLMYHANFKQQDLYPMHFDHSEMWDTWLVEAGFIPLSSTRAMRGS
ncbi:class I SAM-dependent methyltransferase [Vibrio sp.]|uniref:class I SAM-dependent methyltransferase n=1 Tax=Vibrio sp. TaxID=678 RepID=UPI003D152A66